MGNGILENCPICALRLFKAADVNNPVIKIECPQCGDYVLPRDSLLMIGLLIDSDVKRAILSHYIRRKQNQLLLFEEMDNVLRLNSLPTPLELTQKLVLLVGDNLPGLGAQLINNPLHLKAEIGALNQKAVNETIEYLSNKGFIKIINDGARATEIILTLTIEGWEYYESLKRSDLSSRKAFMAMKYGDPELDQIVKDCIKPAVAQTGFDLVRLDDAPKAGLIDDRLRVEIRTSRFLIADLTHDNRGAYWEAGFAEGLGKPVIYTCDKEKFKEKTTHFDTNHHLTVMWDKNDLDETANDIKNVIRSTLPEDAILIDDE
jgi:DNA-binding MarR family transcriptional regulator